VRSCWCGGDLGKEIGRHYQICDECGAAVLSVLPEAGHFDVSDDDHDFYGRRYWTEYCVARGLPDIRERARADLSERCLFWLERLLEVTRPPGRVLEIGCGHGAFVRLLQELGFDATGTELSGWVADFAKQTFGVPVLRGPLETLTLDPGFACIAAFDVLEHLSDPSAVVRRCGDLLAPDGLLVLQTPWYRGEGADWSMLQEEEHVHLFTEGSIRLLLTRAGFQQVLVRPSLFPYDMWVVATRGQFPVPAPNASTSWRMPAAFMALLDLSHEASDLRDELTAADADRTARLAQVNEVTRLLGESEADRAARLDQVQELTALLQESEADRAARLTQVEELTRLLNESEADRAARLDKIHELSRLLDEAKRDGTARLNEIRAQINELSRQLGETESDRVARLEQIHELSRMVRELDADREARTNVVHGLEARIAAIERSWMWRLRRALLSILTGRPPGE